MRKYASTLFMLILLLLALPAPLAAQQDEQQDEQGDDRQRRASEVVPGKTLLKTIGSIGEVSRVVVTESKSREVASSAVEAWIESKKKPLEACFDEAKTDNGTDRAFEGVVVVGVKAPGEPTMAGVTDAGEHPAADCIAKVLEGAEDFPWAGEGPASVRMRLTVRPSLADTLSGGERISMEEAFGSSSGVEQRDLVVDGGLSQEKVEAIFALQKGGLRRCFERARDKKPDLESVTVSVELEVSARGRVVESSASSDVQPGVAGCTERILRRMRLPRSDGATAVKMSVVFEASE